jgi:branched-chain amino acid transport system permease protein
LYTWLQDSVMRATDYWRAVLGSLILVLVVLFPQGVAGAAAAALARLRGVLARTAQGVP